MDPGEQITGIRDEHYNLISVLYHALHGAENCEIYMADAEVADRGELAAFFREAQAMHTALAEQAKGHLGTGGTIPGEITQGGATVGSGVPTSGWAPEDVAPGSANVQQEEQLVDDMPDEPPDAPSPEGVLPTTGASPGTGPPPDEDIVAETGASIQTPRQRVTTLRHRPGKRGRQSHPTPQGHKTPHPGRETRRRAPASSRRGRT